MKYFISILENYYFGNIPTYMLPVSLNEDLMEFLNYP